MKFSFVDSFVIFSVSCPIALATMLPTDAIIETVAFLHLFDLQALAATNALCSSLAVKASNMIRCKDFSDLRFGIADGLILIYRRIYEPDYKGGSFHWKFVTDLMFPTLNEATEFVLAAFPNCIVEGVTISTSASETLLDTIGRFAESLIVKGVLRLPRGMSIDDSLSLARKFRKVKVSSFIYSLHERWHFARKGSTRLSFRRWTLKESSDDEISEIANLLRGSSIEELRYDDGSGLMKVIFL